MIGRILLTSDKGCISLLSDEDKYKQCIFVAKRLEEGWVDSVSINLLNDYLIFINYDTDSQPVDTGLNIRNLRLYTNEFDKYGYNVIRDKYGGHFYKESDYLQDIVVSNIDSVEIVNNIDSNFENEEIVEIEDFFHGRIASINFRDKTKEVLNR